jgi:ribokinase
MKVTVVGSINMDLVSRVTRFPQPGETILGGDLKSVAGGKGANQAVAAARLGAEVSMVGRLGDDAFATLLKSNLSAEGIDTDHVLTSKHSASGVALILVNEKGQNTIVVTPGANGRVTEADVERATGAIAMADVLLLQLEIPLRSVVRAAQIAHQQGVRVILNPAPAQTLPPDLLTLVDILVPNETELQMLLGEAYNRPDERELASMAEKLQSLGPEAVLVTAGARGALLADANGRRRFPAFSPESIVDSTAAGDAFVGSLASAIASDKDLPTAILWGNAAGMLAVTRAGAQPSLPTRAEVEAVLVRATVEQRRGLMI